MASGLTSNGLVIEAIDDIRSGIESDLRNAFFAGLPLGDSTLLGHIVGIIANQIGLLWERLEEVNAAQDPDQATGPALDKISVLTGTFRQPPTATTVFLYLCGTDGTTVNAGSIVATASTGALFDTRDTVLIDTANAPGWTPSTVYTVGTTISTLAARCYICMVGGTSSGVGSGPSGTGAAIADNTVTWQYLGEGDSLATTYADCEDTGDVLALAYDVTVIQTPVSGWGSVRNITDGTVGTDGNTDEELRLIRQIELTGSGGTTADSLRAAVTALTGVVSCSVFVNRTDATDGNGLPPHSFEVLVRGGVDQDIVNAIGENLPLGIATYSSAGTFGTFVDSQGVSNTIFFTRPTSVNVYVDISVNVDASQYPSDGDIEVEDAILAYGAQFTTDKDVDHSAIGAQGFTVDGVLGYTRVNVYTDVINPTPVAWAATTAYVATVGSASVVTNDGGRCYICTTGGVSAGSGGPTGTATDIIDGSVHWRFLGATLVIGSRQIAVFDSTRTAVHSTPITP